MLVINWCIDSNPKESTLKKGSCGWWDRIQLCQATATPHDINALLTSFKFWYFATCCPLNRQPSQPS